MHKGEADEAWERRIRSLGLAVLQLSRHMGEDCVSGVELVALRFKLIQDSRTSVLLVLEGERGEEKLVAFVGGLDWEATLLQGAKALSKDVVKWRVSKPWAGPSRDV